MDAITEFDGNLLIGIQQALNSEWLTPVMKLITLFGEGGIFWIALCLFLLLFRKTRRLGIICSLSLLLTFVCCNLIIKPLVDRTRPWVIFEAVHAYLPPPGDASFPSGHSANSMAPAWAAFIATLPGRMRMESRSGEVCFERGYIHRISICLVVLALLIGISRLYLGMHYPTDVVCGLLLGMICATAVYAWIRRIEIKRAARIGEADGKYRCREADEEDSK